jgi:hypothetical protein
MSHLEQFHHQTLCPLTRQNVRTFNWWIGLLDIPSSTADHALHEPMPANVILICCHQAVALSLILTDLSHSNTTLAFGKLYNAAQEFRVSVNFGEPVFKDFNWLHECINPSSMITE